MMASAGVRRTHGMLCVTEVMRDDMPVQSKAAKVAQGLVSSQRKQQARGTRSSYGDS